MRQSQRRRRRRHSALWLLLAGLLTIAVVTLGLIYRGAKVSGPDSAESASHHIVETTPTAAHVQPGTYTASGQAEDPDGEALTVRVYLRLLANGHYRREIQVKGETIRRIIDSGTYDSAAKSVSLSSLNAVIFNYASAKAMTTQTPRDASRYGGDHAAYPDYLATVLNNRVTLKRGRATTYRYVRTTLPLQVSDHNIPSVGAAVATEQPALTTHHSQSAPIVPATTSAPPASPAASSPTSSRAASASASHESAAAASNSTSSSTESAARPSSSALTLADAQAIIAIRYPSQGYQISGGTEAAGEFTFTVTDNTTHESRAVTVTADGQLR